MKLRKVYELKGNGSEREQQNGSDTKKFFGILDGYPKDLIWL